MSEATRVCERPVRASVYTSSYRGGASWFVLELAAGMAAAGGDVVLIAPKADPEEREQAVRKTRRIWLPRGSYGKGSRLVRLTRTAARIAASFIAFARARRHSRVFVISFYDWLIVMVLQQLWIRLLGGYVIYVVHDAKPHAWSSSPIMRRLEVALLRLTYRIPQQLVTLTQVAKHQVISDFGRAGPVSVIPHGSYKKKLNNKLSGGRIVLAFGTLRRNKRIIETIEGVKKAVGAGFDLKLVIAGSPHKEDEDYWNYCSKHLLGTEKFISTEIGFVPESRVDELISRCDAVILPYEEFSSQSGVAVLAACSERVLICTNSGGLSELHANGLEPIFIDRPVTSESVADALCRFASYHETDLRSQAERSRVALEHYLSWDRIGKEYLDICKIGQ